MTALDNRKEHYIYRFTMEHETAIDAELRFLLGAEKPDVFLDNITLTQICDTAAESGDPSDAELDNYKLLDNYPNPFNSETMIRYILPQKSLVTINVYNILGGFVQELCDEEKNAGYHETVFDASLIGSGVYFYELKARSRAEHVTFRSVNKFVVVK